MNYRLKITDEAANQLFEISKWYANASQSVDVATTWYNGFVETLEGLAQNALLGGRAPESDLFSFELRELHYGSGRHPSHRELYRITGETIEVLSIRHHAQRPLTAGDL